MHCCFHKASLELIAFTADPWAKEFHSIEETVHDRAIQPLAPQTLHKAALAEAALAHHDAGKGKREAERRQ
jgi:hypothetical protein